MIYCAIFNHKKHKTMNKLYRTIIVPVWEDNYSYIIACNRTNKGVVVDPVDPGKVIATAMKENVELISVLTTHNHVDHAGGNIELKELVAGIEEIYGGVGDHAAGVTKEVSDGKVVSFGDVVVSSIYTPCHTAGHVCYFVTDKDQNDPSVYTGDTMFVAGCGNFNDGTPEQMHAAMVGKLGALPAATKVFVGHEYTVNNLKFAQLVEPDNTPIADKLQWALAQRENKLPTVPSTIADELLTNPFCRVNQPVVQSFAKRSNPIDTIAQIRHLKSNTKV